MAVNIVNAVALALFAVALCYRLEKTRRGGGGLQALAMVVAIAALTLAMITSSASFSGPIDDHTFPGAARAAFYSLLAVSVAALVVVFLFGRDVVARNRRAGVESIPLVVAIVGLNIAMQVTPRRLRTLSIDGWTVTNVGFAVFFIIAGLYMVYGFGTTVTSIVRFRSAAPTPVRMALTMLALGLATLCLGSVFQTLYVVLAWAGISDTPWLLSATTICVIVGVIAFLIGVALPMLRAKFVAMHRGTQLKHLTEDLEPLWSLVTGVLPEVILPSRPGDTGPLQGGSRSLLAQRKIVEIRDALVQLSPLLPDDFNTRDPRGQARALRTAVAMYQTGMPGQTRDVLPGKGSDLIADAEPLRTLSLELDSHAAAVSVRTP